MIGSVMYAVATFGTLLWLTYDITDGADTDRLTLAHLYELIEIKSDSSSAGSKPC